MVKGVSKLYTRRHTEIRKGTYELDDRPIAIKKRFFKSLENQQKKTNRFIYEIQVIEKLKNESPFITYIYKYDIKEGSLYMEFMNMNLKELYLAIHGKEKKFSEQLLGCITVSVINALSYCHERNIIHCDVKPTNVLINQHGKIKLTDFGSAIDINEPYDRIGGTMAYWAPDLFNDTQGSRLDPRRDIWSLGITLAEVLLGRLPYLDAKYPVPEGYETIKYLNKIDKDNNFLDCGFEIKEFRDESAFYGKFARLEYNNTIIQFLSVCLRFIEKIPSLTELQKEEFYRACPKDKDEIYEIVRSHISSHFQETTQFFRPSVNSAAEAGPSPEDLIEALLSAIKDKNKNAELLIPIQSELLMLSIRITLAKFSDFKKLLEDKDKFDYYTKKAHEFYTEKLYADIKVYPHFSKPKGLAIIINEIVWAPNPSKKQDGAEKDAVQLKTLFKKVGYEIYQDKIFEKLTKNEMLGHLKDFATDVRHKNGSSCIVVIMAHGDEDIVYIHEDSIHINHEIKPLFNGENAKYLVGKPKFFIYQACRGEKHDVGVDFDDQDEIRKLKNSLDSRQKSVGACFGKPKDPHSSPDRSRIPIYSDFFTLYATVRTTPAFCSPEFGSVFISAICYTFYKFAHLYDLEYMARFIRCLVANQKFLVKNDQTQKIEVNYQQPELESANLKEFYMFPGVHIK